MTCVLCFPVVSENSHRNRLVTALPEKEERSAPKIIGRPRRRRQEDLNCYRHSSKKTRCTDAGFSLQYTRRCVKLNHQKIRLLPRNFWNFFLPTVKPTVNATQRTP